MKNYKIQNKYNTKRAKHFYEKPFLAHKLRFATTEEDLTLGPEDEEFFFRCIWDWDFLLLAEIQTAIKFIDVENNILEIEAFARL